MYYHDGWSLIWMLPMILLFIILIALVVYGAVRIANDDSRHHTPS